MTAADTREPYWAPQEDVYRWHVQMEQPAPTEPSDLDEATGALRCALIDEEVAEFAAAWTQRDWIEMIDALGDILFVVCGAAVCLGRDLGDLAAAPRASTRGFATCRGQAEARSLGDGALAFRGAWARRSAPAMMAALRTLAQEVDAAAAAMGIELAPFYAEIVRSNNTKVGGEVRADGKRLKPAWYEPPDLVGVYVALYGAIPTAVAEQP